MMCTAEANLCIAPFEDCPYPRRKMEQQLAIFHPIRIIHGVQQEYT